MPRPWSAGSNPGTYHVPGLNPETYHVPGSRLEATFVQGSTLVPYDIPTFQKTKVHNVGYFGRVIVFFNSI